MRRLQQIPGVGPLIAHALVMAVGDARRFDTARDCAAWIGLTPLTNNSAEKTRIGHISRQGDHSLRRLLVLGAANLMRRARVKPGQASAWVQGIMARRPFKVATVAQAARIARIAWAMLRSGDNYRAVAAHP
jgi:transposase